MLTYRFLIDLQKSSQQDVKLGSDDPLHIAVDSTGSLSFVNRALGSIGATIDLGISAKSESDKDGFSPKTSVHEPDAGNGTTGPLDVMEEARFVGGPLSGEMAVMVVWCLVRSLLTAMVNQARFWMTRR